MGNIKRGYNILFTKDALGTRESVKRPGFTGRINVRFTNMVKKK